MGIRARRKSQPPGRRAPARPAAGTLSIRMYAVGFGDAFLVSFPAGGRTARILFDCGSIAMPAGRTIADVARRIIADATDDGQARIDVVVATHRHRDHVSGFALPDWSTVQVGEVWMPWTEDDSPAARAIREAQARLAETLGARLAAGADPGLAELVQNALANEAAMTTLHRGFAGEPRRRYLPAADDHDRTFTPDALPGVTVHVLGPSRDKAVIQDMTPPRAESYLRLHAWPRDPATGHPLAPFPARFERRRPPRGVELPAAEREAVRDAAALSDLDAAAALDQALNGTSLVIVLDVGGTRLLFPGDAQWGTWAAAMGDPAAADLLRTVRFYKVGHHGSENATPRRFVEGLMPEGGFAMVSTAHRAQWPNLPKDDLLLALDRRTGRKVARSDRPAAAPAGFTAAAGGDVIELALPLG